MRHAVCWMTDYFAAECWLRACIDSTSPLLPCRARKEAGEEETTDVD